MNTQMFHSPHRTGSVCISHTTYTKNKTKKQKNKNAGPKEVKEHLPGRSFTCHTAAVMDPAEA